MGIIETIKQIQLEEAFEKGIQKGIEKKNREFIFNVMHAGRFTISEIANFANVSESFVKKLKKELKK